MTGLYVPASLNIPNMGFMIPSMGMKKQLRTKAPARPTVWIADALFTKVQQRVLGILFGNPGLSFYANEVIALAGSGTGAVQRELTRLEAAGLLTVTRVGNQKHYRANTATPVFEELHGLVLKTSGLSDVLRTALEPLAAQISAAFVFGSVAKGQDSAESDIDLMVVSDSLSHADLFAALEESASRLGRPVNPTVYSQQQLAKRVREDNAFIKRVLAQPKLWLMGDQHGFAT
jgi:predicted nucleotidyltransferase